MIHRPLLTAVLILFLTSAALTKDPPVQTINWPSDTNPVLRFTFGRLKKISSRSPERYYDLDTTAQNLWNKRIDRAEFSLYMFDQNKVRVGEGYIQLSNVGPGETVKFQVTMSTSGTPVSYSLAPRSLPQGLESYAPPRAISVTVNSVPQGATLLVDGVEAGTTPKLIQLTQGKHTLQFKKEGFNPGTFPMEIGPNDTSGGSLSYELGTSAHDTVELRDGTVITGDVESMSPTEVRVLVGGQGQTLDRNKVKRILLVERSPVEAK
jgi:hypothetical protein